MEQRSLELKDKEDFISVINTQEGIRFISRILDYCGIFTPSFSNDVAIMSFKEGKRDVGLMLWSQVYDNVNFLQGLDYAKKYRQELYDDDIKN